MSTYVVVVSHDNIPTWVEVYGTFGREETASALAARAEKWGADNGLPISAYPVQMHAGNLSAVIDTWKFRPEEHVLADLAELAEQQDEEPQVSEALRRGAETARRVVRDFPE